MKIPKTIHYCWFGGKPLPKAARRCIASWKKYLPDYEIKEWNESNYDVNKIPYTRQAYSVKKYAYVSDYARFDIMYNHGGVYFDTDVEVIKNMDDILAEGAFMGCEIDGGGIPEIAVNPGLGLAAEPHMDIYKKIMCRYEGMDYLKPDGTPSEGTVVTYATEIMVQQGLKNVPGIQRVGDITVYPEAFFCPYCYTDCVLKLTEDSRTIHHYAGSWLTRRQRAKSALKRIAGRLVGAGLVRRYRKLREWFEGVR